jgi:phospholipase C
MPPVDRRAFMRCLASAAVTAALPKSIEKALAVPAHHRTGTIQDVGHVVFLMQENRAFDHYFGTLRGVRGYGDPHPVRLPSGKPVWFQPDGSGVLLPYRPAVDDLGLRFLEGTPHGWADTQAAWNGGKYDQWVPNKGRATMAYLTRRDIPFHYALADAFTICDGYYCSLLGPTDPNRYHMWTGWTGNDGRAGGPVIDNAEAGYGWSTYPERLERAGISWKVYQDIGVGLDAAGHWGAADDAYIGNYGDNSLLYFHQYRNASPGSALYDKARRGTNISVPGTPFDALFSTLREDVRAERLPQVSWIVAPEAFSEHGNWPANYGAWYISQVLDALTSNPDVWSRTVLFVMYDENDGFFDHLVPPTPPRSPAEGASTVAVRDEIFAGNADNPRGPYGLGIRVPMIVVSPWSKGGWVCSQVFDHTSLIRFLERRFAPERPGLIESNITAWRRTVCGDLTSAFDFTNAHESQVEFPDTSAYLPPSHEKHPDFVPQIPTQQAAPAQESGSRPARALPYELHVVAIADIRSRTLRLSFENKGQCGACFQVRSGSADEGPWTYTVEAGKALSNTWQRERGYDLSVFGPNGFYREFRGSVGPGAAADFDIDVQYDLKRDAAIVHIVNRSGSRCRVQIANAYRDEVIRDELRPGRKLEKRISLEQSFGWYDLTMTSDADSRFFWRFAGHLENGRPSMSDPAFGHPLSDRPRAPSP